MNLIPQAARDVVGWALTPIVKLLIRMRVRPNVVSAAGTLVIVAPRMFFGAGSRGALLFWIVVCLALLTAVTVVQRVVYVARTAGTPAAERPPRQRDPLPGHAPALRSREGH